jgi:hypothetical protein
MPKTISPRRLSAGDGGPSQADQRAHSGVVTLRRGAGFAGLIVALAFAGCGGGDDSGTSSETPSAPTETSAPSAVSLPGEAKGKTFTTGLPAGWVAGSTSQVQEYFVRDGRKDNVELGVSSSPVAGGETGLRTYVQGQVDQIKGFTNLKTITEPKPLAFTVGGERATTFDWVFNANNKAGQRVEFHERRVMLLHGGRLYDVKFQSPEAGFERRGLSSRPSCGPGSSPHDGRSEPLPGGPSM